MNRGNGGWDLTGEALEQLLRLLDADRERAAERYELIRRKLIRLFAWRGCAFPEELADETINRVAKKLVEGTKVKAQNPSRYFAGVAHRVFLEVVRREQRERRVMAELGTQPSPEPISKETERRLSCLDSCLARLDEKSRTLIVEFYRGSEGVRIANRKRLAAALGITVNALRIRAHRLRARLESCILECLEK